MVDVPILAKTSRVWPGGARSAGDDPAGTRPRGGRGALPRLPSTGVDPAEFGEIAMWIGAVIACLGLTAFLHAGGSDTEPLPTPLAAIPFTVDRRLHISPTSLLAPAVMAAVIVATWRNFHIRMRWGPLLVAGYAASLAWSLALASVNGLSGLAGPLGGPQGYLSELAAVDAGPMGFLRAYTQQAVSYGYGIRSHPPGLVMLLWALTRMGIRSPSALGVVLAALSASTVPLAAIAVRSLCHALAARRLVPVLVLAPWAVWIPATDGMTTALAVGFVTLGVIGSEPGRRLRWAAGCGLGIGVAALCGYGVVWLGVAVVATYFVRRRPLLNVITGACVLVPLSVAAVLGFSWPDGLAVAHQQVVATAHHPGSGPGVPAWIVRIPIGLTVVLIACGPTIVRATRRIRLTPGWPFLVGAVPAIGFGILTGVASADVERSWLPLYCWLLVPALAPNPRPDRPGDTTRAGTLPLGLTGVGALTAIAARAFLPGNL
ncbi:hypothetical protein [Frankia sp. Cr2]|uniref:hypothetical protein n=1 Tax=Frankia sp. Cr2 TaxID=3073932 RepID=UPI002AD4B62B|nr:hypothetical protein [Frankia sp. Cr2]